MRTPHEQLTSLGERLGSIHDAADLPRCFNAISEAQLDYASTLIILSQAISTAERQYARRTAPDPMPLKLEYFRRMTHSNSYRWDDEGVFVKHEDTLNAKGPSQSYFRRFGKLLVEKSRQEKQPSEVIGAIAWQAPSGLTFDQTLSYLEGCVQGVALGSIEEGIFQVAFAAHVTKRNPDRSTQLKYWQGVLAQRRSSEKLGLSTNCFIQGLAEFVASTRQPATPTN